MATKTKKTTRERLPRFCVYIDTQGEWRWRLCARNRKIVADSAESYRGGRYTVVRAIKRVAKLLGIARFEIEGEHA